jgi:5-methylcytosine-specific restriction enzyme subunit McrC
VSNKLVLDIKRKPIDGARASGTDQYGLAQSGFYPMHAYGTNGRYGPRDVVLIYPKTDAFHRALPVFEFPKGKRPRLWVLPFCLRDKRLLLPLCGSLDESFIPRSPVEGANLEPASQLKAVPLI